MIPLDIEVNTAIDTAMERLGLYGVDRLNYAIRNTEAFLTAIDAVKVFARGSGGETLFMRPHYGLSYCVGVDRVHKVVGSSLEIRMAAAKLLVPIINAVLPASIEHTRPKKANACSQSDAK